MVRDGRIRVSALQLREPAGSYAELCAMSNFTFLRGASHPEELVVKAAQLGLKAIAIADRNSLAGVVRAYSALQELKRRIREEETISRSDEHLPEKAAERLQALPRVLVGARLALADSDVEWVALPRDRAAYARLSRLLTPLFFWLLFLSASLVSVVSIFPLMELGPLLLP
ncbi:MAG TPA: PHP domain-containing protein, partial [Devosia sp.]|nr:PHP domain-containing protein [Devosia sp.]